MGTVNRSGLPCPECGSSDAVTEYVDEAGRLSTYCWSANHRGRKDKQTGRKADPLSQRDWSDSMQEIEQLPTGHMLARGIDNITAGAYGVRIGYDGQGQELHYYFPVHKDGKLLGYQRKAAKAPGQRQKGDVTRIGETAGNDPFGSHLHQGGKMILVTEGAEDCLAAVQMLKKQGKNWRCVGALGTDAWRRTLEYYERFDKVLICFDQDDGGRIAAEKFAAALSPGKPHIMRWDAGQGDDPNQLLIEGKDKLFLDSIYNAKPYSPSGIIWGDEVWRRMESYVQPDCIVYPEELTKIGEKMHGMRAGEISMWTSGSGVGKTSYIRRLKQWILSHPGTDGTLWPIGEVELEESPEKTWRGMMQFQAGDRWHNLPYHLKRQAYEETYGTSRIFTVSNGLSDKKIKGGLIGKFKHLHYDKGCRMFFLDHITLGVREFGDGGGSLNDQDNMMEELLSFVETTKSHMCLISHLRKPPGGGQSWSRGAIPSEEDMKGSGSLYQISFDIIGVSRNKHHIDDYQRNVSQLHVLKCFSPDTMVMGRAAKAIRIGDLRVGDVVIRPDGSEATITDVRTGRDQMYRVQQSHGDTYTVSSRHDIVTTRGIVEAQQFVSGKGFHARQPVIGTGEFPDPWLFGLWIGDGDARDPLVTVAKSEGAIRSHIQQCWPTACDRGVHPTVNRVRLPGFAKVLRQYGLGNTCTNYKVRAIPKRVPEAVFHASAVDRQSFLAGWIDADGALHKGGRGISITIKDESLASDCLRLARSLGIKASLRGNLSTCPGMTSARWYHRVYLSGQLSQLPIVCPRKQPRPELLTGKGGRDRYVSRLTVSPIGEGEYVSITIEGDPLFRLADGTVVHNCRETGDTGPADRLYWDHESSRLVPAVVEVPEGQEEKGQF